MAGNSIATKELLSLCRNIDKYSIEGAKKSITELLSAGANINGTMIDDTQVYTPLFILCEQGAPPSIIQFILEMGADPNQKAGDEENFTALSYLTNDIYMPYLFFNRYNRERTSTIKEESDNYKHTIIQILINTPSLDPNVLDAEATLCMHLFSGYPDILYDFIIKRQPSIATLNYLNGDYRTLLILCCRAITALKQRLRGRERNVSFYSTIHKMELYARVVELLCRIDGIHINVIDAQKKTALDYIRDGLPDTNIHLMESQRDKNHPTGILTYVEQLLVERGAYTYKELQLQKTPIIKRKLGNNNMEGGKKKRKTRRTVNKIHNGHTRIRPRSYDSR